MRSQIGWPAPTRPPELARALAVFYAVPSHLKERLVSLKLLIAALLSTTLGATVATAQALPPPVAQPGEGADDTRLKRLFYDSDEASLKRNPITATCAMRIGSATI